MPTVDRGFDALWDQTHNGSQSWVTRLTEDERAWFDDLIEAIGEHDMMPNWTKARELFADAFGDDRVPSHSTMSKHVRAALKAIDG